MLIQLNIFRNLFRRKIDQYVLYKKKRWLFYVCLIIFFFFRMYWTSGYFAVAYILGFCLLQNAILFITPSGLPTIQEEEENEEELFDIPDTITLEKNDDKSKPVIRKLGEFNLWKKVTFATSLAVLTTFFEIFDFPVFWPLLLVYFFFVVISVYVKQKKHMEKYGYTYSDFFKKQEKFEKR